MKIVHCLVLSLAAAVLAQTTVLAQSPSPATSSPGQNASPSTAQNNTIPNQIRALVKKIHAKLQAGKTAESNYTAELKALDDLIAKNPKADPNELAQIVLFKAMLNLQVFDQPDKSIELLKKIKTDYPTSKIAAQVDTMIAQVSKLTAVKKIQAALKPGATFPDFNVKSLDGKPLSVASRKGKFVLVDFWATWCPPCRAELPNVIATYKKYHDQGFDIIGVSLDSNRAKLESFLKNHDGMTWPQYFDGEGWKNKLAEKYGVQAIPFTILIGPDGKIIGTDLRGEKLTETVAKAVARK